MLLAWLIQYFQNGVDCGPTAASVAVHLLTHGVNLDDRGLPFKPDIPCAHAMRQAMLNTLAQSAFKSFKAWKQLHLKDAKNLWVLHVDSVQKELEDGTFFKATTQVAHRLAKASAKCYDCYTHGTPPGQHPEEKSQAHLDLAPDDSPDVDDAEKTASLPPHLTKVPLMKGARNRQAWQPQRPPTNSSAPPLPPQSFILMPSNAGYDDYLEGPTIEDHATYPKYLDNFPTNPYATLIWPSCWDQFKDYGYRLEPSFALGFNNDSPILVEEHTLPVGTPSPLIDRSTFQYSISRYGENVPVTIDDCVEWGLEQLLDHAADERGIFDFDHIVRGRNLVSDFIHLDLERDSVHLEDSEVLITYDIDSIIWVTDTLKLNQSAKVFVLPYEGKYAPISKSNHVSVEILLPRSEADKDKGGGVREEWFSKPFGLSTIPHTHFAKLGDGAGSVNIYVFFPRMINRHPITGRRGVNIPFMVQSIWFMEVVLPSIVATAIDGTAEYVDYTMEEWRWKASNNSHFANSKTTPIRSDQLSRLQHCMRDIVQERENAENLDIFGSFFFVCDARGIKNITVSKDPYQMLRKEYTSINWDYAMDRRNGQLYLDMGISFHPKPSDKTPLVGLWRINSVEESYAAAGMNKGVTHNACTMADYGGKQAAMENRRSRAVQLCFRSTYNLLFEAVRAPGKKEYFCEDADAYDVNPIFHKNCEEFVKRFRGSKGKSFGVREEIRGSGPAIKQALAVAPQKVSASLASNCIMLNNEFARPRNIWSLSQSCGSSHLFGLNSVHAEWNLSGGLNLHCPS